LTSFKSAQLISTSGDADKVVFLTNRIELGTQSLDKYRDFADTRESVQATENTRDLLAKLKSSESKDTLIVTSIQKMSNIEEDSTYFQMDYDIQVINKKRLVFIVDEAHQSVFGEMLYTIKKTFPKAIFFGFTGTPIFQENQKKHSTEVDVFGEELHRYSIADGIRDKNVLGFDPYMVLTFKDNDIRRMVALEKAKAQTVQEALSDPDKNKIYQYYMDPSKVPMVSTANVKGIEDFLPLAQYKTKEHREMVVNDIAENWLTLSHDGKFHALFATSSIPDAIEYYHLLKKKMGNLKITCLFDPNIDNTDGAVLKEDALVEILDDYNKMYHKSFSLPRFASFKKDVSSRLAHKDQYIYVSKEKNKQEQLDILIVVDQMLTGFDSKWINTLYMDKILYYENIIQAFSRTNRLFGPDKPFGTIRYYRKPHTMAYNIEQAVQRYSWFWPGQPLCGQIAFQPRVHELCIHFHQRAFYQCRSARFSKIAGEQHGKSPVRKTLQVFQ
jgi:type I restriction enzyme R subunit